MGFFTENSEAALENYRIDLYSDSTWSIADPYVSLAEFGAHLEFSCAQTPTFFLCMLGSALDGIINFLQTIYFLVCLDKIRALRYFGESLRNFGLAIILLGLTIGSTPLALYVCMVHIYATLLYFVIKKFKPNLQTPRERLADSSQRITKLTTLSNLSTLYGDMLAEQINFESQKMVVFAQIEQDTLANNNELEQIKQKRGKLCKVLDEYKSKQPPSDESYDGPAHHSADTEEKQVLDVRENLNAHTPNQETCSELLARMKTLLEEISLPSNYGSLPLDIQISWMEKVIDQYANQHALYVEATVLYFEEAGLKRAMLKRDLHDLVMEVEEQEKQMREYGIIPKFEEDTSESSYKPGFFTPEKMELFSKASAVSSTYRPGL